MLTNLNSFVEFHTNYFENVLYTLSHRLRKNKKNKNKGNIMLVATVEANTSTPSIPGIYFNPPSDILRTERIINGRKAKYKVSL